MSIEIVELVMVRIDGGTQSRVSIDNDAVQEYAQAYKEGAKMPPLRVYFDGVDFWLADGFHRYHAAKMAGLTELPMTVEDGTRKDAVLYSLGANSDHGLRRTNADKRKSVMTMFSDESWSQLSDVEISKHCKVTQPFVSKLRKECSENDTGAKKEATKTTTTVIPTTVATEEKATVTTETSAKPITVIGVTTETKETVVIPVVKPTVAVNEGSGSDYSESDKLRDELAESFKTIEELSTKLAIGSYGGTDDLPKLVEELQKENASLRAQLSSVEATRNRLQQENAELKRQVKLNQGAKK